MQQAQSGDSNFRYKSKYMYKEYDVVVASRNLDNVPKGTLGVILIVHDESNYEIEFLDSDDNSLNILTVNESDIVPFVNTQ